MVGINSFAAVSSKVQGQLPQGKQRAGPAQHGLRFHHAWFLWPPVVTQATDINTDLNCSRNTDVDMDLSGSSGWDITMALVASTGHPYQYGPGGSVFFRHQHGLR